MTVDVGSGINYHALPLTASARFAKLRDSTMNEQFPWTSDDANDEMQQEKDSEEDSDDSSSWFAGVGPDTVLASVNGPPSPHDNDTVERVARQFVQTNKFR